MESLAQPIGLHRANGPLYRQLASRLRGSIAAGTWRVGAPLPTEGDLAQDFGVSLITVRAALRELADDGLVRKRPAKAALVISAVSRPERHRDFNTLAALADGLSEARLEVASYRMTRAAEPARRFGLGPRVQLHCLHAVLHDRGGPRSDLVIYFPPAIGRHLVRADFAGPSVFATLERRLGIEIADASAEVSAATADAGVAMRLGCAEGAPLLVNRMLFHDSAGNPVKFTIARHRASGTSIGYRLWRR